MLGIGLSPLAVTAVEEVEEVGGVAHYQEGPPHSSGGAEGSGGVVADDGGGGAHMEGRHEGGKVRGGGEHMGIGGGKVRMKVHVEEQSTGDMSTVELSTADRRERAEREVSDRRWGEGGAVNGGEEKKGLSEG